MIDHFYALVEKMTESIICSWDLPKRGKQKQFLTQFLGGPNLYTEEHGHPMLKETYGI